MAQWLRQVPIIGTFFQRGARQVVGKDAHGNIFYEYSYDKVRVSLDLCRGSSCRGLEITGTMHRPRASTLQRLCVHATQVRGDFPRRVVDTGKKEADFETSSVHPFWAGWCSSTHAPTREHIKYDHLSLIQPFTHATHLFVHVTYIFAPLKASVLVRSYEVVVNANFL